ncbi:MAG: DUF1800 domain-containing protein [Methylocystis sp.]|nr:DUF1800 domain-containing protein [Methylocystis sp.]
MAEQDRLTHVALNRFGLGAIPGGFARVRAAPRAAVMGELTNPNMPLLSDPNLPTYAQACNYSQRDFTAAWNTKELELSLRLLKQTKAEIGFVERLVMFFTNHFSMSVNKDATILGTIGQLERDVIRKHVLGKFENMLIGVMGHPAMMSYLDNADSIGPNSPIGLSWGVGLNHNLAREIFELHTLGVAGGYTEADIDALARALTGWSYVRGWESDGNYNGGNAANRGHFIYRPDWHEPGVKTILGRAFPDTGVHQAGYMLRMLARHPTTAQFIAFKLVRHFITDQPTPAMVDPIAAAYRNSLGDLKVVAEALVRLPEAWSTPLQKLRTPYELQIAQMRALQRLYRPTDRWPFSETLRALMHLPWEHPAPNGYSDDSAYWMGPDAMRIRAETAQMNAWALQQLGPFPLSPPALADSIFGAALSTASRNTIVAASDANVLDGMAMLFMIPEFQRR